MSFSRVKIDNKGRVMIPFRMRKEFEIFKKSNVALVNSEHNLRILPCAKNKTIQARIKITKSSISEISSKLNEYKIKTIVSKTRTITSRTLEWRALVNISSCKNIKKFIKDVEKMDIIRSISLK